MNNTKLAITPCEDSMTFVVELQNAATDSGKWKPDLHTCEYWAKTALMDHHLSGEVTVRLVDECEMIALNDQFRGQAKPTNVLSFPHDPSFGDALEISDLSQVNDLGAEVSYLGDIVICTLVIEQEAELQRKTLMAHYCHMVVHGLLHLSGWDHETDTEAAKMEAEETRILSLLNFPDPYVEYDDDQEN